MKLYRQGKWPETPEGVNENDFMIQFIWVRTEDACGPEALRHKNQNKVWATEEKYELITKFWPVHRVKKRQFRLESVTVSCINGSRCYKNERVSGIGRTAKGRPPKEPAMKKKIVPAELTPSEREDDSAQSRE